MNTVTQKAVLAARRIVLKYIEKNNGDLGSLIQITDRSSAGWSEGRPCKSLVEATKSLAGILIEVDEFSKEPNVDHVIDAMLVRREGKAEVFVSDMANFCHQRFFVAKELCHIALGTENVRCMSSTPEEIFGLLSALINDPSSVFGSTDPGLEAELIAYYGAIEMLLPKEYSSDITGMLNIGKGAYEIAQKYSVPQKIIEYRFQDARLKLWFEELYATSSFQNIDLVPLAFG